MPDYSNGLIYKIVDNKNGDVYYGSTTQTLALRMKNHRSAYYAWKRGNSKYYTIMKIFDNDDYDSEVVEEYPCENRKELHLREKWYIQNNECINKVIPKRTRKEYYDDTRDKRLLVKRVYAKANSERIRTYQKQYMIDHKEELKAKAKIYCANNREKINTAAREINRRARERNPEKIRKQKLEHYHRNREEINARKRTERAQKKYALDQMREINYLLNL